MGFYRHRMPDREIQMAKDWTQEEAARIDAEDASVKQELTSAEYWETQAAMWHNKYVEAHQYELDHEIRIPRSRRHIY